VLFAFVASNLMPKSSPYHSLGLAAPSVEGFWRRVIWVQITWQCGQFNLGVY
jgi:hypothetical protein